MRRLVLLGVLACLGFAAAAPGADVPKLIPIVITISGEPFRAAVVSDSVQVLKNGVAWKHHDIHGLDSPTLEFTQGDPFSLQLDLQFDRYEEGKSVREVTDTLEKLAKDAPQLEKPVVVVSWGTRAYTGTLESARTRFVLFLPDGTPTRAVVRTVWKEFSPAEDQLRANPRH